MFVLEPVEQPRVRGRRRGRVERLVRSPRESGEGVRVAIRRAPVSPRSSSCPARTRGSSRASRSGRRRAGRRRSAGGSARRAARGRRGHRAHARRRGCRTPTRPSRSGRRRRTRRGARTARRSSWSSRSWLQAIAPRSVCWRSGRSRPPAASRPEPVAQALRPSRRARGADPGGGQLDRQRQAVEPADDLRDVGGVLGGQREVGPDRHAPARRTAARPPTGR